MKDIDKEIINLKKEIAELESKKELEKLRKYKDSLSLDMDKIIEGNCPHCNTKLKFDDKDREKGLTDCPKCGKKFELKEVNNIVVFGDLGNISSALCPYCSSNLEFPGDYNIFDEIRCSNCRRCFNPIESKSRVFRDINHEASEETSFANRLSSYKVTVLLSIFFDIFFIFSLISLMERGKLKRSKQYVDSSLSTSFSNWDAMFMTFLIIKVLLICSSLFLGLADIYSYSEY